jgi:hypothetical protein
MNNIEETQVESETIGKYGRKASSIVKWYWKFGRKLSWIVKNIENAEEK